MLKEKRWNPPLRICIGVFLLLFCNVVADVPATTSKNPSGPTTLAARPLLRKVTGNDETELSGVAPDRGVISAGHEAANNGSSGDDVNGEGKINSSREKVAATRFPLDSEKPTTSRSPGEVDKLVTSESVNHQQEPSNRKSRLSNSLDENSGKSLAVTSEKPLRLTRINEGVAKRGHEMTPSNRHDGQSEKKSAVEKVGEIVKEDHEINKNNVKATTVRSVLREVQKTLKETKKKRVEDFDVKESEEFELEDDDENQEKFEDDNISLINDTRVNYSFLYKSRGNQNGENSLNRTGSDAIAKGVDLHEKQDPKKDVEIVKDIESLPSQRLVMENITNNENKRGNKSDISKENSEDSKEEILEKEGQSNNFNVSSESSSSESDDSEEKSSLSSAESTAENEKSTEYNTSINALSRGRTIGFSSENVFSNSEMKTTETNGYKATESLSLNNSEKEVPFEQRPYPYLKSSKNFSDEFKPNTVAGGKEEKKTNEPTPFENAIGQNQSEKKFVVTEPSVVIENSIQQVKPKDPKSSSNWTVDDGSEHFVSIVSSTVSPSTTSQNFLKQVEPSKSVTSIVQGKEDDTRKPFDAENVVPNGSKDEIKPTVIVKTGNFDVTGNAITEINRKLLETAVNVTETTEKAFLHSQGFSTEKVTTTSKLDSSKPDVQTNAEESMLIRSSFNVSEESTEFPLTMNDETTILAPTTSSSTENATVASSVTMAVKPVTSSSSSTTVTSRNLVTESLKNLMQRKTTVIDSTTLNADETSIPTTTRIEYEFVGLTDAIVSENDVTESSNSSISLTTTSGTNTESSNDQTIVTTESSEITSATENVTETSSTEETVTKDTEGTTVVTEETEPTTFETTASEFLQTTTVSESTLESTGMNSEESKITESIPPTTSESIDKKIVIPSTESLKPTTMIVTEDFTATESTTVTTTTEKINSIPGTVTTWSTVTWTNSVSSTTVGGNGPTQRIAEQTTEIVPTLSNDEITSLVRIVVEGTWREVCPRLPELRQSLADILTTGIGTDKQVMPKQIVFHQSPCLESNLSLSTSSEDSLISMLIYVVDENGKFDEEMTKVLPSLYYKVSPINFPVTIHSFLLVQETDSGNAIAAVVISSVAFICLLLLAGLLFSVRSVAEKLTTMTYRSSFIMRKRQTRFNYGERCRPVSLDAYSLDSVPACNSVRRKGAARSSKRSYGNPTFEDSSVIPSHPLNFTGLSSFCGDVNAITEEFSGVPQVSAKMDELPSGAEVKNRYANVVPLPETRVPLQRIGNDPLTEYINANYVRGPKNAMKYYIACQAPMESTVIDFWRMIWEQQTKVIIMLTDLVENGVEKCHEYIPPSEVTDCHRLFGDFQVTLKKRETKEKYAISTLHLKNLENNTFREVYHIWYLWPVNGVQSDGAGLIAVLLEARALQRGGPGPIVVHCSPGTGRTGTLIALDLGIRQYEITRTVDVPRVVYTIRRDRAGAVQTKEQYAFIYKALNLYATKLAGGVLEST